MTKDLVLPDNLIIDKECVDLLFETLCGRILERHNNNENEGFDIRIWTHYLTIKYKSRRYKVAVVKEGCECHWYLKPYNKSYFLTKANKNGFDRVIFAIQENDELYINKK